MWPSKDRLGCHRGRAHPASSDVKKRLGNRSRLSWKSTVCVPIGDRYGDVRDVFRIVYVTNIGLFANEGRCAPRCVTQNVFMLTENCQHALADCAHEQLRQSGWCCFSGHRTYHFLEKVLSFVAAFLTNDFSLPNDSHYGKAR